MESEEADYVVVGAGSAGCVLAARLSEDPDVRVRLLEAGPSDRFSLFALRMPAGMGLAVGGSRYNWHYLTESEPWLDDRRLSYPRGRVVGGSSSINGMVYLRGNPMDYEGWAQRGLRTWSYAHCLPYFRRMERSPHGETELRGGDGPLGVTLADCAHPLHQAYLEAAQQAGHFLTEDVNGARHEGAFRMERSTSDGLRCSASRAYLRPALRRPNLSLHSSVLVTRVLFERGRAVGVEHRSRHGLRRIRAAREVILCGGAFNSPHLLKLSGVGPAEELARHGIHVVHDAPAVGADLQDHLDLTIRHACRRPVSLGRWLSPLGKARIGAQWLLFRSGIGASNIWESGCFFRTSPSVAFPDMQHHFAPLLIGAGGDLESEADGFQVHLSQLRPLSRGWVKLRSADPREKPMVRFNHLQETADARNIVEGLRLTREILAQRALDPFRGEELSPGPAVDSEADWIRYIRATAETSHHPASTCRMGVDESAVVDEQARVRGVENLRVVDASIMPSIVSANLNAATIMMAEKMADAIAGKPALPPGETSCFVA